MRHRYTAWALIALVVATLAVYLAGPDESVLSVVGNGSQTLAGLLAAAFLFRAAAAFSRDDAVRPFWIWLAVGFLLNALGFGAYAWYEIVLGVEVPTPSVADLLWLLAYPALIYGSIALLRRYMNAGLGLQVNRLTGVAVAVVVILAVYFLIVPIIGSDAGLLEKAVVLAYPLLDLVMFAASVSIALMMRQFGSGKVGAPWTFIALGMMTVTVADMVFTYLSMQDLYHTGNLVDLGWILQGALVAWGGILQYRLVKGDADSSGSAA